MKKAILLLFLGVFFACSNVSKNEDVTENILNHIEPQDSIVANGLLITEVPEEEKENTKSLNDIRFANFKEDDWEDNEYIRCLRNYIDDFNGGFVEDEVPDEYKDKLKGKFVVTQTQPYLMGGLLIQLVFIDRPNELFHAWVYSYVDEESETVFAYEVRTILLEDEASDFSKEKLQGILKEHTEMKLW